MADWAKGQQNEIMKIGWIHIESISLGFPELLLILWVSMGSGRWMKINLLMNQSQMEQQCGDAGMKFPFRIMGWQSRHCVCGRILQIISLFFSIQGFRAAKLFRFKVWPQERNSINGCRACFVQSFREGQDVSWGSSLFWSTQQRWLRDTLRNWA